MGVSIRFKTIIQYKFALKGHNRFFYSGVYNQSQIQRLSKARGPEKTWMKGK